MSNYTAPAVDTEAIYEMMAEHAKISMEANELVFERMFETDELDPEVRVDSARRELELATRANRLAFDIASKFMTDEFIGGFREHWNAKENA